MHTHEYSDDHCHDSLGDHPRRRYEYHHVHSEKEQRAILNRLSKAIGHLESIRRMVEEDRDCSEVLVQLSAVRSAITNTGKIIMMHHLEHCVVDAIKNDEPRRIMELKNAIDQFIK